jgi:hypothetical protein
LFNVICPTKIYEKALPVVTVRGTEDKMVNLRKPAIF